MSGEVLHALHVVHDEPVVEADGVRVLDGGGPLLRPDRVDRRRLAVHQRVRRHLKGFIHNVGFFSFIIGVLNNINICIKIKTNLVSTNSRVGQ